MRWLLLTTYTMFLASILVMGFSAYCVYGTIRDGAWPLSLVFGWFVLDGARNAGFFWNDMKTYEVNG